MLIQRLTPVVLVLVSLLTQNQASLRYRNAPGRVLRYHEETTINMEAKDLWSMKSSHDASIVLAFREGGAAEASYERLSLSIDSSQLGSQSPDTSSILGKPFALIVSNLGEARVKQMPAFPKEIQAVTDLSHQFDDFFVRLPPNPDADNWSVDFTVPEAQDNAFMRSRFRLQYSRMENGPGQPPHLRRYREQGGVLITFAGPQPGNPSVIVDGKDQGTTEGTVEFDLRSGTLVSRNRKGSSIGLFTYTRQGSPPVKSTIKTSYVSRLHLRAGPNNGLQRTRR